MKHAMAMVAFLAFVVGCGSSYDANVTGQVTLDGVALTKGNVAFIPTAGGPVANGAIGTDGSYTLRTATEEGLAPGEYKVTVVATDPPPPGEEETPGILLTPPIYGSEKTTPLTKTVKAGSNPIDLNLTTTAQ